MAPKIERKPKSPEAAQDPDKQRRLRLAYSNKLALLNAVVNTPQYALAKKEVDDLVDQMEWEPDPTPVQHSNEQSPPPAGGAGEQPFNNGQSPPPAGQQPFNGQSPPPVGQQPFNNGQTPPPTGETGQQPLYSGESPPPAGHQTFHNSLTPSPAPSDFMEEYGQYDVDTITVSFDNLTVDNENGTHLGYLNRGGPGFYNVYQLGGDGQFKRYYTKRAATKSGIDLKDAREPMETYEGTIAIQGVVIGPGADISALIPSRWPCKQGKYGEIRLPAPWCLVKVVPDSQRDGPSYWMTRGWVRQKYGKNPLIVADKDYVYNGKTVVECGTEIGYADLEIISSYIANQVNYGRQPRFAPGTFRKSPSLDREVVPPPPPPPVTTKQPAPGVQFSARPATRLSPQIPPSQGYQAPVQPGQVIYSNTQPQSYQAPVQPGQVIYSNTQPQGYQAPAQPGHVVYPCLRAEAAQWISAQGQPVYPNNQPQAVPGSWSPSPAPTAQPGPVIYADNGAPADPVAQLLHHGYWTSNSQSQPIKQEAA